MTLKIHLVAACGTGMGTLACILKEMGHSVTGSDQNVYPPMSDFLEEKGISLYKGYAPSNLDHNPDLVIIGNAVSKDNPEAEAVLKSGIEYISMPQAVNRFIAGDKQIILVTGTHGKTTTSSIMAHILHSAGMDPSFMIGGIVKGFNSSFKIGKGQYMVIEGDEYDTAFFDKGPKFMHYKPEITIMTGIEFDHADIFKDLAHIKKVFSDFVKKNQETSHFIAYGANKDLMDILSESSASIETYGHEGDWFYSDHSQNSGSTLFKVSNLSNEFKIQTALQGTHNVLNSLACIAVSTRIGLDEAQIKNGLKSFSGVKRRQEVRAVKKGITVMDDFAHHPTAVKETIRAVKPFYPDGRLIAVFEPRTNTSMRKFFQDSYPDSFLDADMVCICQPCVKKKIDKNDQFVTEKLVTDINNKGGTAYHFDKSDQVVEYLSPVLQKGDLVLIMSNGGFDNIHNKLIEKI